MNRIIIIIKIVFLLNINYSFSQEKEIDEAKDYFEDGKVETAYEYIQKADAGVKKYLSKYDDIGYITEDDKLGDDVLSEYYYIKGQILYKLGRIKEAISSYISLLDYEKGKVYRATQKESRDYTYFKDSVSLSKAISSGKYEDSKIYDVDNDKTKKVNRILNKIKNKLISQAMDLFKKSKFMESKDKFVEYFNLSKDSDGKLDTIALYNAYVSVQKVISSDLDSLSKANSRKEAVSILSQLIDYGFTNEVEIYRATDRLSGKIINFKSKEQLAKMMKLKVSGKTVYINDTIFRTKSVKSQLYANISIIYYDMGDYDNSLKYISLGITKFPNEPEIVQNLMQTKLRILSKQGKYEQFYEYIQEYITANPNLDDKAKSLLYFNVGVASYKIGKQDKAKEAYKKSIELDKSNVNSYVNLSDIILSREKGINDEINSIPYPYKNNKQRKRIKFLEKEKKKLYKEVLVYLEAAYSNGAKSEEVLKTLRNIYYQLEMNDKLNKIRKELKSITNKE